MTTLVLRSVKNTTLTNDEVDENFVNLAKEVATLAKNSNDWVANTPVLRGDILLSDDRFYLVSTAGTTGATKPTHTSGTVVNGTSGLQYVVPSAYTPKDVLDKIKTLDGVNSGLDSDFVRGFYPSITTPLGVNKTSVVVRSSTGDIEGNLVNSSINNCSIGLTNPGLANFSTLNAGTLNVAGTVNMIGTLNLTTINSTFANLGNHNFGSNNIEVNLNGTGSRSAILDFHGDDVYADYSLRLSRDSGGQNANSRLIHRGTGTLSVETTEGGVLSLPNTLLRKINSTGSGGRVVLESSDTSSISGNVAVEVINNTLRITETSFPFRGATLDIPSCLANAASGIVTTNGTQLLSNKTVPTVANTDDSQKIASTGYVKTVTNSLVIDGQTNFNGGIKVGGNTIDVGSALLSNAESELKFHSSTNSDFDAKITKKSGVNGALEITNLGTGGIKLVSNGQTYHGLVQIARKLILSQSSVAQSITNADTLIATSSDTFELQITPRLSNSWFKIYVRWAGEVQGPWEVVFNLRRNGTRINSPSGATNYWNGIAVATSSYQNDFSSTIDTMQFTTVDTSGSVAGTPITYSLVASCSVINGARALFTNRCAGGVPQSNFEAVTSEIIIEEIAQ